MKPEIEAKFVRLNHDDIRQKLNKIGAKCEHPMRKLRRVTIDTPEMKAKNAFVRIRHQGDITTITYKQFDKLSLSGAKEIEIIVNDYEAAIALFTAAGLTNQSHQESRRETWKLGDVEIVLDEWPWLDQYIEIEGPDEQSVQGLAAKLELDWEKAVFGDVMAAYRVQYPHLTEGQTIGNLPAVKFDDEMPEMLIPPQSK